MTEQNVNWLAGLACPVCGSLGPFDVVTETRLRLNSRFQAREPSLLGGWDYGPDSYFCCLSCNYGGLVADFSEDPNRVLVEICTEAGIAYEVILVQNKVKEAKVVPLAQPGVMLRHRKAEVDP